MLSSHINHYQLLNEYVSQMLSSHINRYQLLNEYVSHNFFVFYQMLNVKIAMLIFYQMKRIE